MDSNTEDFTKLTKNNLAIKAEYLRNANSTVKRLHQRNRPLINVTPLPLTDIKKQWEEAENEPLPGYRFNIIKEENEELEKENVKVEDSFDLDFEPLSTPAKSNKAHNGDFATPRLCCKVENSNLVANTPRIQCSVNMQQYLMKTPLNNLCKTQTTSCKSTARNLSITKPYINRPTKVEVPKNQNKTADYSIFSNSSISDMTFKKIKVKSREYIILNQLGKGGSSEVYQCFCLETKSHRAIKCVSLQNPASAEGYINEVNMLEKLQNCDRIVTMYDFEIIESEKSLLVVLEVGGADLSKILKELATSTSHLPLYMLIYYWMEMLHAVKQIHSHGIVHADLKPANFLKAESGLKLIDFGISTCIQNDMTSAIKTVPEGSFNYISPEALHSESSSNLNSPSYGKPKYKLSYKSDVWSLGCILYQMVYRRTPFQHISQVWTKLSIIVNPKHRIEYPAANWVPQKILSTIQNCLQYDVKLRPSVDDLINDFDGIFQQL